MRQSFGAPVLPPTRSISSGGGSLRRPTRSGRETRYEVTPAPLEDAVEWMVSVGTAWDERLAALRRSLAKKS